MADTSLAVATVAAKAVVRAAMEEPMAPAVLDSLMADMVAEADGDPIMARIKASREVAKTQEVDPRRAGVFRLRI